jgi:hypothetical protein
MHHLSYHKPLKHILIELMVDNDVPVQSEKKHKNKQKHNKTKPKNNNQGDKK